MAMDVYALLEGTVLPHLADTLKHESLGEWAKQSRLSLLQHLKHIGVERLVERQALANAFGRAQRGESPDWKAPLPRPKPSSGAAVKVRPTIISRPLPPPMPFFDSTRTDEALQGVDAETHTLLQRHVLSESTEYEEFGLVRVRPAVPALGRWTCHFGECADPKCGCYRLKEPRVRRRFRNLVVNHTHLQLTHTADATDAPEEAGTPPPAARYVTIGCGSLLTDVEILLGLAARGLAIAHICVCDSEYCGKITTQPLLRALAALFPSARVVAFNSLDELRRAAKANPEEYGRMSTFAQVDASGISDVVARGLAGRLLLPGGHFFQLGNDGPTKASTRCHRRMAHGEKQGTWQGGQLAFPTAAVEPDVEAADSCWAPLLTAITIDEGVSRTNPLGEVETDESWERPLYDGCGNSPTGGDAPWQARQASKGAEITDAELTEALNLL